MSEAPQKGTRGQAGYTLIEVIVAGTLLAMLVVGVSSANSVTQSMISDYKARSRALMDLNVLRTRLIADARTHERVFCNGTKVVFRTEQAAPAVLAEYRVDAGRLIRWHSAPDRDYVIVDRADSLTCTDLDADSVEVEIALGTSRAPTHLYLIVAPVAGGGNGNGNGNGGGKGKPK